MNLYDAQSVVQISAGLLLLLLLLLFPRRWVFEAIVVNAEAEEDLHGAESVVEVVETHLIETWKQQSETQTIQKAERQRMKLELLRSASSSVCSCKNI